MMRVRNMTQRLGRRFNNMKKLALKIVVLSSCLFTLVSPIAFAQLNTPDQNEDITSSNFSLVVCDGPDLSGLKTAIKMTVKGQEVTTQPGQNPQGYTPCDFAAAMKEIQHLINIMIIVGVVAAIAGFCYAGFLLVTKGSSSSARSEASGVFKKVFIGFIIMLTAWFIVYQVLSWLQCGFDSTDCKPIGTALLKNSQ